MFDGGRSKPLDALRLTVLEAKPLTMFDSLNLELGIYPDLSGSGGVNYEN